MNILHISRTMGQGGAEKVVYQLCTGNKTDNQYVISAGGFYVDELKKRDIKHYKVNDLENKNPFIMLKTFGAILRVVKCNNINIIHTHHRMAAFYACMVKKVMPEIRHIYTAHNIFLNKRILTNKSLEDATVVAVGNGVKSNLMKFFHVSPKSIKVIPNSIVVDKDINEKNQKLVDLKNEGKTLIANIGRLSEQKGMDVFIKAIKQVVDFNSNVVGIIVGDGEDRKKLEALTKKLDLQDNILFLGYQNNIYSILNQIDFVVLSSRWEGFPLTPIEAFAMKKTVVATNILGNNEIVKNKKNGILFQKDNANQLAQVIMTLINNKELINKLSDSAYYDYLQKYSYKSFLEKYNEIYY